MSIDRSDRKSEHYSNVYLFETFFFLCWGSKPGPCIHWSSISPLNYISAFPFNLKDVTVFLKSWVWTIYSIGKDNCKTFGDENHLKLLAVFVTRDWFQLLAHRNQWPLTSSDPAELLHWRTVSLRAAQGCRAGLANQSSLAEAPVPLLIPAYI